MLYNNKSELLALLRENSLYTKKRLGQNFLVNTGIIDKIVQAAELNDKDNVIEIGPGMGILTNELIQTAAQVNSIELDETLIPYLTKSFGQHANFQLLHQDALKFTPPNHDYKLVANIPYYITSPILSHFLGNKNRPGLIVLLVQKEVAEKICAQKGDHSVLSLQTQVFGKPKIIAKVKPGSFHPAPKVYSAILKISVYNSPIITDTKTFFKLIKAAFSQKRKTLSNTLIKGLKIPAEIFKQANIYPGLRPQNLSILDWKNLVEKLI